MEEPQQRDLLPVNVQLSETPPDSMNLMATDSPLKSAIRANSSYKIREFEWFEVETKIRLFVQKLLEPTLKQIYDDRKIIDGVQWSIKVNNDQVDMLKDVVLNQGVGIPIFEEFHRRVFETELKVEQERRKNTQDIARLESAIERITFECKQLGEQCRQTEAIKQHLIQEFNDVKQQNLEFREQMTIALQNLQAEMTTNFTWARQSMQRTDEKIVGIDLSLQDYQNQLINIDKKIQDLRHQSLEFTQKHSNHVTRFERIDMQLQTLNESVVLTKKLTTQVQNLQNSITTLDNYVSTYQPLYIQGQISESLFHCLPQMQLNKLASYEQKRFEEIHKSIIGDEGNGKVAQKINEYTQFMEGVARRNSKLVQVQKIKKATEEESEEEPEESEDASEASSVKDDFKDVRQIQNKKVALTGAEAQHYEEMIQHMRNQINDETREFKSKIELTVKDVYSQIKELDEQLFMEKVSNQDELDKRHSQSQQNYQNLKETLSELENSLTNFNLNQANLIQQIKRSETVLQSLIHYLVLVTHLLIQDEIDRQGIALMGVKDTNIDDTQLPSINRKLQAGNRVLQVKPECLTCSSHPLTTVTAFKLACLAYNPSDITVDGKVFKRDQLLEVCTKVLWAARREMTDQSGQTPRNENTQPVRKSSSKKLGNLSVDARGPLTNAHLQIPQTSPSQTDTNSNAASKMNRFNMINLRVEPPQTKRQYPSHRNQKRLFNMHQNLSVHHNDNSALM